MRKQAYIILFFLIIISTPLWSQDQPLRIEFESEQGVEPYVGIPCGIYGVLTIFPTMDERDLVVNWKFILLDVNLKPVWSKVYEIGKELKFRHDAREKEVLYLSFSKSGKTKDEINLQLLRINLATGEITDQKATIEGRPQSSAMAIHKNNAVIGIERSKGNANLLFLDFNTMTKSALPFELSKNHKLLSITFDKQKQKYCFISSMEPGEYTERLDCFYWKPLSNEYTNFSISSFGKKEIINNAQLVSQGDTISLIIGGYNDVFYSQRNYADEYGTPYSGLFTYNLLTDSLKMFPLSKYENIFSIISANDIKNKRKQRDKDKDLEVKLLMIFHEPIIYNDEIVVLSESYYPQFHTVSSMAYDYYGRPLTTYYDVFDGFRYNKAIVTSFDLNGNIAWSNHMDIRDVIVDRNKKISTLVKDNKYYMLAYAGIGNVASQVINKKEIIDDITVARVDFLFKKDRLMDTGTSTIEHWYGSYFIVSGYQTIRNSRVNDSGKRTVFYMNKMAYK